MMAGEATLGGWTGPWGAFNLLGEPSEGHIGGSYKTQNSVQMSENILTVSTIQR